MACAKVHLQVAQVLLEQGKARPDLPCAKGWTPLRKAVQGGHGRLVIYLLAHNGLSTPEKVLLVMIAPHYFPHQKGLVQLLLRHKVNVNARDAKFRTPLHLAAQAHQPPEFLAMLLQQNNGPPLDLEARHVTGDTPLLGLWRTSHGIDTEQQEDNLLAIYYKLGRTYRYDIVKTERPCCTWPSHRGSLPFCDNTAWIWKWHLLMCME